MAWVRQVSMESAGDDARKYIREHGIDLETPGKAAIELNNAVVYEAVELNAWKMDDELQRLVGKKIGDLLEYAISVENRSVVCSRYFTKCIRDDGYDPENLELNEKERAVFDYGTAIARDFHHIPQDVKDGLKKHFTDEEIVVITGMAVVISADNLFETILEIE